MASYYIHMDQGLVVDLRHHTLCSGQFSNCAPIVFYNANNHYGGLYHLAGCRDLDEMKTHHLRVIETVVRPTAVYVLCGADENDPLFPATGHVAPVCAMFAHLTVHRSFNGLSSFSSVTVSEVGGAFDIRGGFSMANKLNKRAGIRALPDDVGFIGETDDEALKIWI